MDSRVWVWAEGLGFGKEGVGFEILLEDLDGLNGICDVVLAVKNRMDNRFLAAGVDVLSGL